jgi:hypothetical protein
MRIMSQKKSGRGAREESIGSNIRPIPYLSYFAVALGVAGTWTLIGSIVAHLQGDLGQFISEWQNLQGPFLIGIGTFLVLISRSGALESRARKLAKNGRISASGLANRLLRLFVIGAVLMGGSASIIGMGFNARGWVLGFIWVSCVAVCGAAGVLTLHTIDLLLVVQRLERLGIKIFSYAPARTPELRDLISYFTSFTLVLSIGYLVAFIGIIKGHWTGDPTYIEAVQWFWPLIYVPVCSAALIYPHLVMHRLVKQAKEQTLSSYQIEIDALLIRYPNVEGEDVQKINNLAQLFDRISATPDYVIDLGIAVRTGLPLAFNLAILVTKPILGQS